MKSIKGTQTEKNLMIAFAGESAARNRYNFFAGQAKKDGYIQLSDYFLEIEDHERAHAKRFYKFLQGGNVSIRIDLPAGTIGTTAENLKQAIAGENKEWQHIYPAFARTARDEGFEEVAVVFESIAAAEKYHARTLQIFLDSIESETVFQQEQPVAWKCRKCGFVLVGTAPPPVCPACTHPSSYFEILSVN